MQDHPIPQAVTSYEFHLIGNMTLKQFLELASGFVLAIVIYQTNLYPAFKWPIMIILVGVGALIAFIPYEGRPLDQWFVALIKAIYRPTLFFWKKKADVPEYFTYTKSNRTDYTKELDLTPYRRDRTQEYITSLPSEPNLDPIEQAEKQRLSSIITLFEQVTVSNIEIEPEKNLSRPDLTIQPRSLQQFHDVFDVPEEVIPSASPVINPTPSVETEERKIDVIIPEPVAVSVTSKTKILPTPDEVVDEPALINIFSQTQATTQAAPDSVTAQTSSALPFPKRPKEPNIIVGMVFNKQGGIVDSAIVEITDNQGLPVRAVKTNSIGQFSISTPLKDGEYYLKVEKEGVQFTTQKLVLNNTIIDPIEIKES